MALDTIRLWRFDDRGRPERQDLARLAAPWTNVAAWAVGLRAPGAAADRVAAWQPGLYRLDLLIEPAGRIRMVMLSVRGDGDGDAARRGRRSGDTDPLPIDPVGSSILGRLPQAANLWTVGEILTGWARPPAAGDCRVVQIWRARGPEAGCWPVPIGPTSALGVNLPAGQEVATIELAQVDPLPGPVELASRIGVGGRPGVAALETPAGGLADGIYRMTVALVGGVTSIGTSRSDRRPPGCGDQRVRHERSAVDGLPGDPVRGPRQDAGRSRRSTGPALREDLRGIRELERLAQQQVDDPPGEPDPADDRERTYETVRSIPAGRSPTAYGRATRASVARPTRNTMMPLPTKALRDSGGARPAADPPPGQDAADDDEDAGEGRQRPTPAEWPSVHRQSTPASPAP